MLENLVLYMIVNEKGLYSNGGLEPLFGKKPKIWTSAAALNAHLRQFNKGVKNPMRLETPPYPYDGCSIVIISNLSNARIEEISM